ncbi:MAG: hypothetical protein R3E95_07920 [Thiolinea sp.]
MRYWIGGGLLAFVAGMALFMWVMPSSEAYRYRTLPLVDAECDLSLQAVCRAQDAAGRHIELEMSPRPVPCWPM